MKPLEWKTSAAWFASLALALAVAVMWLNWPQAPSDAQARRAVLTPTVRGEEPVQPLPPAPTLPEAKVKLGERLFFETRLSADDSLSCASCHDFNRGGADALPVSVGVKGAQGSVNAPTVFNVGLNFVQFWDGRAASLEDQVPGPVHNPVEMASNWDQVIVKLKADPEYSTAFGQVYADGITAANIIDAIATYERTLVTPNARFDRYLAGQLDAIDARELAGYLRFKDYGCASCHQGVLLGANMYQRFGVMADYFAHRQVTESDLGRYNVTKLEEDRHVFKVPGLRNVAVTGPYFHDGSVATLEEAVMLMGRYQLGRDLNPEDIATITAFLKSLTGHWQGRTLE
ncbi:MAG: cytochrome-c peroxidase [Pseudomonadota bacterium]